MYQEFDAQTIPCIRIMPRSHPIHAQPHLNSGSSALDPHPQSDMPVNFAPADDSRASSVKVISGHFGSMAGPPLTLHSDVTGAAIERMLCCTCHYSFVAHALASSNFPLMY
jgi:hypothetical protein